MVDESHKNNQQPPSLSVGGPQGIQILGSVVQLPGGTFAGPNSLLPQSSRAPVVEGRLQIGAEVARIAVPLAIGLFVAGPLAAVVGGVLIAALGLPLGLLVLPAVCLFGSWGLCAGVLWFRRQHRRSDHVDVEVEQRLLELAAHRQGRLVVPDVARALGMPLREADEALTRLARRGYLDVQSDPQGNLEYVVREFEPRGHTLRP